MTRPNGIHEQISLADHSSMRLGGKASYFCDLKKAEDVGPLLGWAKAMKLPVLVIGGGNNIIFRDAGFEGLVLRNKIKGIEVYGEGKHYFLRAGAGESWDRVVAESVSLGLTGIETLSYIPGTVGAAPIQNIGAYGQEIAQAIEEVTAYNRVTGQQVVLSAEDCEFEYRSSRFNRHDKGTYIILEVVFRLQKGNLEGPFYPDLERYFEAHQISEATPAAVRAAIKQIRRAKLPDPEAVPNCGSFFYNPILGAKAFEALKKRQPEFFVKFPKSFWSLPDGRVKLAAGAMIDYLGFKGFHDSDSGMAVWPTQALVLYNEAAHSTTDLLRFKQKIVDRVKGEFGVELIQEPELV